VKVTKIFSPIGKFMGYTYYIHYENMNLWSLTKIMGINVKEFENESIEILILKLRNY